MVVAMPFGKHHVMTLHKTSHSGNEQQLKFSNIHEGFLDQSVMSLL